VKKKTRLQPLHELNRDTITMNVQADRLHELEHKTYDLEQKLKATADELETSRLTIRALVRGCVWITSENRGGKAYDG